MLDAHVSQYYEWLPWTMGQLAEVPKDPSERKKWLASTPMAVRKLQPEWREALEKRYGAQAVRIQHAEAFEITDYGRQPSEDAGCSHSFLRWHRVLELVAIDQTCEMLMPDALGTAVRLRDL